jgi:hypothetical protein
VGNSLCLGGVCQPCTVCPSGCFFDTVQPAINAAIAGETIRLCAGLYPGDLVIGKSLTLIGAGGGLSGTILQGSRTTSVVRITGESTVSLQGVRITNGSAPSGGGIANNGTLALTGCTITGNTATSDVAGGSGGGIANQSGATLTLTNSTVSGNTAITSGGGIFNNATLTLSNSTVSGNTATSNVGGGIFHQGGLLTLDAASHVTGNQSNKPSDPNSGGGIFNNRGTVMLSSADNVSGNTPDNCGGDTVPLCTG